MSSNGRPGPTASYADTLRGLGRFLEPFEPSAVAIFMRGERLGAYWRSGDDGRDVHVESFSPESMRAFALGLRLHPGGTPRLSTTELLRVIGQELDRLDAEYVSLMETADGFHVNARVRGFQLLRTYTREELLLGARHYRAGRLERAS